MAEETGDVRNPRLNPTVNEERLLRDFAMVEKRADEARACL